MRRNQRVAGRWVAIGDELVHRRTGVVKIDDETNPGEGRVHEQLSMVGAGKGGVEEVDNRWRVPADFAGSCPGGFEPAGNECSR